MAIKTITLPDGRTVTIDEWLHWPIYSTCEIEGGIGAAPPLNLGNSANVNLTLFSYVVGTRVPQSRAAVASALAPRNATTTDTNQVAKTRMNHDEAMLVFAHFPEYFALDQGTEIDGVPNTVQGTGTSLTGTNIRRLQRDIVAELLVGANIRKPQARAPLGYFTGGVGAPAWGSGDQLTGGPGTIALNYGTSGKPTPQGARRWNLPVHITSARVMKVTLKSPGGPVVGLNQSARLRWWLDGIKRRPVA